MEIEEQLPPVTTAGRADARPKALLGGTSHVLRPARVLLMGAPFPAASLASALLDPEEVGAVARSSPEALARALADVRPDVLVLCVSYLASLEPGAVSYLRNDGHPCRWMIGWPRYERRFLRLLIDANADAAIRWSDCAGSLERAALALVRGDLWFPRAVLQDLYRAARAATTSGDTAATSGLSARESEVHALMREGMTNQKIANRLGISLNTVKKHVEHVYAKTGVRKRRQMTP